MKHKNKNEILLELIKVIDNDMMEKDLKEIKLKNFSNLLKQFVCDDELIKTPKENWKDIKGYEEIYKINKNGVVLSKKNNRPLKWSNDGRGYYAVSLTKDNKTKFVKLHRLIAIHFIPNPQNKPVVNHIDGNKLNNNITNLEWVTYKENTEHAMNNQLINTGIKIMLIDHKENKTYNMRSKRKASLKMGMSYNYINIMEKQGRYNNKRWSWSYVEKE